MVSLQAPIDAVLRDRVAEILPAGCEFEIHRSWDLTLRISPPPSLKGALVGQLPEVVASVYALLPLRVVQIGGDAPLEVSALLGLWPTHAQTPLSKRLEQQHRGLLCRMVEAAISELRRDRSVFLINSDGIYARADLSSMADPPCTPEAMVGKTVRDVIGEEAHEEICRQIKLALSTGQERGAFYRAAVQGEVRTYVARIQPLVNPLAWVSVTRL